MAAKSATAKVSPSDDSCDEYLDDESGKALVNRLARIEGHIRASVSNAKKPESRASDSARLLNRRTALAGTQFAGLPPILTRSLTVAHAEVRCAATLIRRRMAAVEIKTLVEILNRARMILELRPIQNPAIVVRKVVVWVKVDRLIQVSEGILVLSEVHICESSTIPGCWMFRIPDDCLVEF